MEGLRRIRLLLVDDEEDFRRSTGKALSRRGFDVTEAASGLRALEQIVAGEQPDLVLLDLRMEGLDGIATLRELRALSPSLPVIILTGQGTAVDAAAGIDLEISDFLQKPVDIEHLTTRIRRLLERGEGPLRERHLLELIVPEASYRRVWADEPLKVWVEALREASFQKVVGHLSDRGHRSVLVFEREGLFLGVLRWGEVIRALIPDYAWATPHAVAFTGLFLAQAKVLGAVRVRELIDDRPPIDLETPLLEATHVMARRGVNNLPVSREGRLVGLLRDRDILLELARVMS